MGIKEWFGGWQHQKECGEQMIDNNEVKKEPEITFESYEDISRKNRIVRVNNNEVIGEFVFNNNRWEWKQAFRDITKFALYESLSLETMIAITEKLKELNGCSDVKVEIAKLEQRLWQLEMMNSHSLTKSQVDEIVLEINCIRKRLMELP